MTTITTLHAGHDVAYLTSGQHAGGCVGAMSYYTASGEPPGQWAGKGAAALGLTGQVDPAVIARLYQHNIGPGGELLVTRRQSRAAEEREEAAVAAYRAAHPYASATELAEVRAAERGTDPHQVPYFDLTVDVVKSVSVLHASYRVAARQARERGDQDQAAALDARAEEIEAALLDAAREAVAWLERHATYTRTGHHSARTGEWRDGDGLVASVFLHHISRDGDPHLHVHVAVWNRVQRADGADEKWRTLDSRSLHNQRLAVAPVTDRIVETRLSALGYAMVPRADGNGAEVGGVSQDVMDLFSSRSRALTPELKALIGQYQKAHGKPPSKRTIWLLGQQAAQNTRRTKAEARRTVAGQAGTAEPTAAQRLAAWEAQTARREVQALSAVHQEVARFAAEHAGRAPAVLDDAAKRKAARIAVAEVQQHHAVWSMAQLRFEVHRALPVLPPGTDAEAVVTEVAKLAVSGRAGTEVIQVTAPDLTDVTSLGVRASDGGSIYRPPNEERYCTLAHLDTEQQILTAATRTVPQLVTAEQARAAAERTGLNAGQRDAVVTMLTATTATTALVAAAGAGKSHTMAEFARLWTTFTGRRVIGLATATNAARVLASEGLAESYNIAQFLGKIEGSDELRRPVPLHENDVLVLDEASQLSTTDLAMVQEAARAAGARLVLVGDTEQLGAVEAGGMFRLLAQRGPVRGAARGPPVRRRLGSRRIGAAAAAGCSGCSPAKSRAPSCRGPPVRRGLGSRASVRLRAGDFTAYADYDRHGRMRGADQDAAMDRAAGMWLADHLRGKNVLLLAGSNSEAAELSRRVQAKLIQLGTVQRPHAALSDGNQAGTGDLIRARLNTKINAGGRELTNRDTLKITGWHGPARPGAAPGARRDLDQPVPGPPGLPGRQRRAGLRGQHPRRARPHRGHRPPAGHRHPVPPVPVRRADQGTGVQHRAHRHREHRATRPSALSSRPPRNRWSRPSWTATTRTCPPPSRSATPRTGPAEPATCSPCGPPRSGSRCTRRSTQQIKARLTESEAWRYEREHSRPVLQQRLRAAQLAGHDIGADHRADHRRADGPRPVHLQRPARPPPAARAARPRPRRDLGAAHTEGRARGGARAGRRAGPAGPRARRTAGRQPRAVAGQPARRPGPARLAAAARGLRPAGRSRRGLPGSRRDHRPRPGHRPRIAPWQPRTRPPAPDRDPRPGTTRRNRDRPRHDPRRARGPDPRRGPRPGQRPARRLPGTTAHRPSRGRRLAAIRRRRNRG